MGFGLRMLICGGGAVIIGAFWFFDGLQGEDPESTFKGGIWKGPLLFVAGIGAIIMGVRILRERFKESEDNATAPST